MRESTSTSDPARTPAYGPAALASWTGACAFVALLFASVAWADGPPPPPGAAGAPAGTGASGAKTFQPEDDDFSSTPYTDYGEFNEERDEESDTKFLQHGRLFGVSLGVGFEAVDGNRGLLWQGGFPMIDFKVHYWFDFNIALDLGFFYASHFFETTQENGGHVDVNLVHVGLDVKYYFDTKNLAAPISFANPYLVAGFGSFTKTQNSFVNQNSDSDSAIGLSGGAGLEFTLAPRKTYFEIEGKIHIATFKDTATTLFRSQGIPDLSGNFYTLTGNILFTW